MSSGDLEVCESNRLLWQIKAIGARARGDFEEESAALQALRILDTTCPRCTERPSLVYDGETGQRLPVCNGPNGCGYGT